jgi:hypothetical protein
MRGEGEADRRELLQEIKQSLVTELAELLELGGAELLSGRAPYDGEELQLLSAEPGAESLAAEL